MTAESAWTDIDGNEGAWPIPALRTKENRERLVPLCQRALEILEEVRALSRGSPLVFLSMPGKPLGSTAMSDLLKAIKIAAVPYAFQASFRN